MERIFCEEPVHEAAIDLLLASAFPTPAEALLVRALRAAGRLVLSVLGEVDGQLVGYAGFSAVQPDQGRPGLGLAPLAVMPGYRRRGLGSRLVKEGLKRAQAAGWPYVVVLGEPQFYAALGFEAASRCMLNNEYGADEEFRIIAFDNTALPEKGTTVRYSAEFAAAAQRDSDYPAGLSLRAALREDVPIIASLIRKLAEYERLSAEVVLSEEKLEETLFGAHRYAEVIIAEIDEATAGFALFFHNYSTFLSRPGIYIEDLFVLPEQRGRGVGRAMLRFIAQLAVMRGCGRVEWAVLDWNSPAIGFYRKLEACPLDEWTVFRLTGDALKRLGDRS